MRYNAKSTVESCRRYEKCYFYEPSYPPEYYELMNKLCDSMNLQNESKRRPHD